MDVLHFGPAELIRTLTGRERAGQGTRMVNSRVIGGGAGGGVMASAHRGACS